VCTTATQTVTLPTGYAAADMMLTGYEANFTQANSTLPLWRSKIALQPGTYTPTTGQFTWSMVTDVRQGSTGNDAYSVDVHFVIILSDQTNVIVNDTSASCAGNANGNCTKTVTNTGFAPNGMSFAGYGFRSVDVHGQALSSGIALHQMKEGLSWSRNGADTTVTLNCIFANSLSNNTMGCGANLVAVTGATQLLFPQNPLAAQGVALNAIDTQDFNTSTGGLYLGALVALSYYELHFDANDAHNLWRWDVGFHGTNGGQISYSEAAENLSYSSTGFLGSVLNSTTTTGTFYYTFDLLYALIGI
jgi:hypothetical protein